MNYNLTFDQLNKFRTIQDPIADQLVCDLFQNKSKNEIGVLYKQLLHNFNQLDSDLLPTSLKDYFEQNQDLPNWIDEIKIKLAHEIFLNIGPEYATSLICRALPLGYVSSNVVELLATTGYLSKSIKHGTAKRLLETSQFLLNVMQKNTFEFNSDGMKHILKVRFIHAMVRKFLTDQNWKKETYGHPINQEDLSLTILTFSVGAIDGLRRMNIFLSLHEKDALVHYWSLVGHLIGIDSKLNPTNYKNAKRLYYRILKHQASPSENGQKLTAALSEFMKATLKLRVMPDMPDFLIVFLINNSVYSDMLGLPDFKSQSQKLIFKSSVITLKSLNIFRGNIFIRQVIKPMNKLFVFSFLKYFDEEFKMKLIIPKEFRLKWGISDKVYKSF